MATRTADIPRQSAPPNGLPLPVEVDERRRTPVFGTAEPASGPVAWIRRQAYALPTHEPTHWLLLLAADRAEVAGELTREAVAPGQQRMLFRHYARQARAYPHSYAAIGGFLVGWLLGGRR